MGRIFLVVWLLFSAGLMVAGWRERATSQAPEVPITSLAEYAGRRVRVHGSITSPTFDLPNGHRVAFEAVSVWVSDSVRKSSSSYTDVWPRELWLGEEPARVRIHTLGLSPEYVRRVADYWSPPGPRGAVGDWLLPLLTPRLRNGHVTVHAVWPSEVVKVVGVVSIVDGQAVIRGGGITPLIMTTMPVWALDRVSQFAGSWKVAVGLSMLGLGLTIWLWLRAGFRHTIGGVAIYPLVTAASHQARNGAEIEHLIDRNLAEAGVDPRVYRRQRRANNRRALVSVLATLTLGIALGVLLGEKPVSVEDVSPAPPPSARVPPPPGATPD